MERWGWSLDALFDAGWTFTPEDIVRIIGRCCDGLEYAGDKGILHTDLHLGNILVNDNLEAKLSDFGMMLLEPEEIIRQASVATCGPSMSKQSTFVNKYTAPEILSNGRKAATKLSDMYSLGRIGIDLLEKIDPKEDYGRFAHLRSAFNKAASYSPEERFKSFNAFKKALEGRKTNWLAIGAITAGLGLLAGTGYLLTRRHSTDYSQYTSSPAATELADVADAEACGGSSEPIPDASPDIDDADTPPPDTPLPDTPIVTDASAPRLVTRIFCSDGKIKMGRTQLTADDLASPYLHPIPRFPASEDNDIRDYLWIKTDACMDNNHNVATAADLTEVRRFLEARGPVPEENTTYWGYPREEDKDLIPFVRCERGSGGILRAYLDLDKINLDHLGYIIHRTEPLYPGGEGGGLLFINLGQCLNPRSASRSGASVITFPPDFCPSGNVYSINDAGHRIRCCNWNGREVCTDLGRNDDSRSSERDAGVTDASIRDARRRDAGTGYHPLAIMQNDPYVIPANQRDRLPDAGGVDAGSRRPTEPIEYADLGIYRIHFICGSGTLRTIYSNDLRGVVEESIRTGTQINVSRGEALIDNPEYCPELAAVFQRNNGGDAGSQTTSDEWSTNPADAGSDEETNSAEQYDVAVICRRDGRVDVLDINNHQTVNHSPEEHQWMLESTRAMAAGGSRIRFFYQDNCPDIYQVYTDNFVERQNKK